ncbi:amino acid permease [Micromonospora sonneratiae]|uniref:APC family permease n=1 Tax=Micromonospora sonneratiae TaxID=1184706 RepID=A0ABW3YD37_9ACTN
MSGMTVPQGAALSIGAVLGTGVIALPALAAQIAGPAALLAWLALIILSVPLAATFAALGTRNADTGGVATYVRRAFGVRAATVVGWCFYFAVPAGAPPAAMFAGAYVESVLGGGQRTTLITAALLIVCVTATNAGGLRVSGRVQLALAGLLAVLLLVAMVTALPHARLENLQPFAPNGWLSVGVAATVLVWGFAGWEAVSSLAADFRRPERDLPRATAVALVVVGVLYLGVAAASVLVLGAATGSTEAPLAELLVIGVGGEARVLTAAVAVLLTLGTMNAYFAGASRLGAALGRDGALPGWFAPGSAVGQVPRRSLLVLATLAGLFLAVVAVTGIGSTLLVRLTSASFTLVYVLGTAAAVRLLPRGSWSRRAAVLSFGAVTALLLMTGVYVLWTSTVAFAALVYASRRRGGRGATGLTVARPEQSRGKLSRAASR